MNKKNWETFDGRKVSINNIDHQHMSNIYWYNRLVWDEKDLSWIQEHLDERFNGQILPYRPHRKFAQEIQSLRSKGYLTTVTNDLFKKTIISVNGVIVGEILEIA